MIGMNESGDMIYEAISNWYNENNRQARKIWI